MDKQEIVNDLADKFSKCIEDGISTKTLAKVAYAYFNTTEDEYFGEPNNQTLNIADDEPVVTIQHPCPTCGQETMVYLQQED